MRSKVAVIPCRTYDEETVFEAVEKGISLLGGWESFIKPEEKILLKPNLLNRADPNRAATTHPAVFEAVSRSLLKKGFRRLVYGDSPGIGSMESVAESCGLKTVAECLKIPPADFSRGKTIEYAKGKAAKKFEIGQGALDADAIVNLCKMKTHQLERITGAVKNMFGCVYGLNKKTAHARYPDPESFARMLVDLNLLLQARIHIMDGVVAMEGNGPFSGNPTHMDVILISADPVALDATFCRLIDLEPDIVPTVYFGEAFGLGHMKEREIEIIGIDDLNAYRNTRFDAVREKSYQGAFRFLNKLSALSGKPVILGNKCVRCGDCVDACPVEGKAVFFPEDKAAASPSAEDKETPEKAGYAKGTRADSAPVYDYKKCIRCYCCQEICPEQAIIVKRKFF